jgi:hypothetical protein
VTVRMTFDPTQKRCPLTASLQPVYDCSTNSRDDAEYFMLPLVSE